MLNMYSNSVISILGQKWTFVGVENELEFLLLWIGMQAFIHILLLYKNHNTIRWLVSFSRGKHFYFYS